MSRINKLLALLLLFCTCLCHAEDMLISPDDIVSNTSNYKTTTAVQGSFTKSMQGSISIVYPEKYYVCYEGPSARYVATYVKKGDTVTKGQLLAELAVTPDEVTLYESELKLTRAKQEREQKIEDYRLVLDEQREAYLAEADIYKRETQRLKLQKLELQYEKYLYQSQYSIDAMQEDYDELLADSQTQYVYAPADGVVDSITYLRSNESVYSGQQILQMYNPNVFLFKYDNSSGNLRYNMQVTLSCGPTKERQYGVGRVVADASVKPGSGLGSTALIALESFEGELPTTLTRPTVEYTYVYIGNATIISRSALTLYGGMYHVFKLSEDGMVSKRYVNQVANSTDIGTWIINGVEPGETLILN